LLGGERAAIDDLLVAQDDSRALEDYELIAQHVSEIAERVTSLENRVSDVLSRLSEVERVNKRLEDAALITARALEEISGHWDAVYEAMRRKDASQEAAER
jgi:DNA-binding ferritin-like protein